MSKTHDECIALLEEIRWGGIPICPYCESTKATAYKKEKRYHCNNCFTSYSVTVGTLFHKSHIDLWKWFQAIHLVLAQPDEISVRKLALEIGVSKNTAFTIRNRINTAMIDQSELLRKILESIEA